jgi:homocysteine S-methyltransferase
MRGRDVPRRYVAASVGPFGATRHDGSEYHGDYGLSVEELTHFHEKRFAVLAGSGADVLACETIPSLDEVRALVHLLGEHPAREAWVSCTSADGERTAHGEPLRDVARLLDGAAGVVAVGVNCLPPDRVLAAIGELRRGSDKPIVVYPNSGERWNGVRHVWEGVPGTDLASLAPAWIEAGATLIGGCCRTGPADIARLTQAVAALS